MRFFVPGEIGTAHTGVFPLGKSEIWSSLFAKLESQHTGHTQSQLLDVRPPGDS